MLWEVVNDMTQLHEAAKKYLKKVNNIPSLAEMTAEDARTMRAKLPTARNKIAKLASIDNTTIPVRDGASIPIRIYTPEGSGSFPILIYYHGGGWVLNDLNTCHESCSFLAKETNSIVVSVEYRLAPEYKFPVPLYDAYDAFLWVRDNVGKLGGVRDLISVAGDSAGGNLATAVTLLAKKEHQKIAAQILLYPVTELSYSSASYSTYANGYGLDKDVMKWFGNYYIRQEEDRFNPLLAPLLADVRGLPSAFVLVAENDVLRDEGSAYAKKIVNNGILVEHHIAKGMVHSFFTKNESFEEQINHTIEQIASFLKRNIYSSSQIA